MLCYRCEHRARFLEDYSKQNFKDDTDKHIHRPRHECGDIHESKHFCYMFQPVKPVAIEKAYEDDRPISLNILSVRVKVSEQQPEFGLKIKEIGGVLVPSWEVCEDND